MTYHINKMKINYMSMLVDIEIKFDKIQQSFIIKMLNKLGIKGT